MMDAEGEPSPSRLSENVESESRNSAIESAPEAEVDSVKSETLPNSDNGRKDNGSDNNPSSVTADTDDQIDQSEFRDTKDKSVIDEGAPPVNHERSSVHPAAEKQPEASAPNSNEASEDEKINQSTGAGDTKGRSISDAGGSPVKQESPSIHPAAEVQREIFIQSPDEKFQDGKMDQSTEELEKGEETGENKKAITSSELLGTSDEEKTKAMIDVTDQTESFKEALISEEVLHLKGESSFVDEAVPADVMEGIEVTSGESRLQKAEISGNSALLPVAEEATDSAQPQTENADEAVDDTATESETPYEDEFSEEFEDASDLAEPEEEMPSLRPREVPQAPRNFTSFIMDEHDDCELFIDFGKDAEVRYPVSNSVRDQEFFDQDFQNVYQSTRETEALELPREILIERILEMREKVKVLHDQLADKEERDPRNILTKLHAALLDLQEENKKLRNRLGPCKIHGRRSQEDSDARERMPDSYSE